MIPKPLQITTDLRARWPDSGQKAVQIWEFCAYESV